MEGANIDNILTNFKKLFQKYGNKTRKNYRSTQRILDGAWSVVSNNKNRAEKSLKQLGAKEKKYPSFHRSDEEESNAICDSIKSEIKLNKSSLKTLLFFIELMPSQDLLNKLWLKKVYLII